MCFICTLAPYAHRTPRTPGPTQRTNIRLNERFRPVLAGRGSIDVKVITEADASEMPLDFEQKPDRLVVENA